MLESLLCNSCGAPLDVPESANFIKCIHCNTSLKIHRSGGATSTEAIEKLAETAEGLAEQVEKLTRQNELASLDRDWETRRQSFIIRDKQGNQHLPNTNFAWVGGAMMACFGLVWTIFAFSIVKTAPTAGPFLVAKFVFPLFGIGFTALGVFIAVALHRKTQEYQQIEREYQQRRKSITEGDE